MFLEALILGALYRQESDAIEYAYEQPKSEKERDELIFSYVGLGFLIWPLLSCIGLFKSKCRWYVSILPVVFGAILLYVGYSNGAWTYYFTFSALWALVAFFVLGLTTP
jgi:uncharacterized membrane protein